MVLLLEFGTNIFFGVSTMTLKVIPLKEGTKMPKPHKCRALWQHLVFCVYTFFKTTKRKVIYLLSVSLSQCLYLCSILAKHT